ncbi:Uncharacterised protein [Mycobacterium tuberculosis]|uniref:PE family protein n=1 Tax=Mycobacterium tuberculosis TaxID=1773 RepID=A0A0T7LMN9_MYCTX|nr:Uncharacterised protein [Mycobacterium tuberculosis]CFE49372.1 Uncharacterised protein [Mycobacterium tuberculosis]CFR70248.1 Uncharacterised protein [Mycobacterium tuberculosis]CFS08298.1 Uncharacterised protein [Mycobacterium tuberculosis]CKP44060.1 Uncharacterised protein [Mycobacterium tuberculosis]
MTCVTSTARLGVVPANAAAILSPVKVANATANTIAALVA